MVIKGYVKFYDWVPVTWERESEKFVYNVRKVAEQNGRWVEERRLFEDKIPKKEVRLLVREAGNYGT